MKDERPMGLNLSKNIERLAMESSMLIQAEKNIIEELKAHAVTTTKLTECQKVHDETKGQLREALFQQLMDIEEMNRITKSKNKEHDDMKRQISKLQNNINLTQKLLERKSRKTRA